MQTAGRGRKIIVTSGIQPVVSCAIQTHHLVRANHRARVLKPPTNKSAFYFTKNTRYLEEFKTATTFHRVF